MVGSTLSHYEVLDELGRGGMGVVYRARDVRLDRIVALKVLPSSVLASEEDRARFFREAKAAAQLQHPHIAAVFDSDEAVPEGAGADDARPFIALEYIDGRSLADRIEEGPLKLSEAVRIALEMALALEAAHEKAIVHRDIKPQNVMLTSKGDVKVLDFGLAKTAATTMLTRQGSTLGTVAYMSPEQAAGEEVDRRSDLWSLGVVLYEMITGRHPFARDYEQAVVYSILNEDPEPVTALRTGVSMELEHMVDKALEKNLELRYQSAADLIADLKAMAARGGSGIRRTRVSAATQPVASRLETSDPARRPVPAWIVGLVALLLGVVGTWFTVRNATVPGRQVMRLGLEVLPDRDLPPIALSASPSGTYLAYTDRSRVYVRDLQTSEVWDIPDSEGVNRIVFTPDEEWLLLERPGQILRTRLRDGVPFEVTTVAAAFTTVNVAPDGALIYEGGGKIWRLGPAGEAPELAIETDTSIFYNEPRLTPDGRTLLVELIYPEEVYSTGVFDFPSGRLRGELPLRAAYNAYLDTGHLVYVTDDQLHAVPLDLDAPRQLGPAIPLGLFTERAAWSVVRSGHLFYAPIRRDEAAGGYSNRFFRSIRWDGSATDLPPAREFYEDVRLDPAGRRAAVMITEGQRDVWIVDLFSGFRTRITSGSTGSDPSWHPNADSIVYVASGPDGDALLAVRDAGAQGAPREVYRMEDGRIEDPRWSLDGRHVLFTAESGGTGRDIWQLDLVTASARPIIGGGGDQANASYSPDGRFIVYEGPGEDGEMAVWVQSTAFTSLPWKVSQVAGGDPRWVPDGSAIYFMSGNELVRVDVEAGEGAPRFSAPVTVQLFTAPIRMWDLLPDGSGMVHVTSVPSVVSPGEWADSSRTQVHVILNWADELSELVPVPR